MKTKHKVALIAAGAVIGVPVVAVYSYNTAEIPETTATPSVSAPAATPEPSPSETAEKDDRPTGDQVLAALASQTGHADPEDACPSISWMCNVEKVTVHTGGNVDIQYSDLSGIDAEQAARAIHNMLSAAELFPEVHVIRVMGPDGWERAKYGSYL